MLIFVSINLQRQLFHCFKNTSLISITFCKTTSMVLNTSRGEEKLIQNSWTSPLIYPDVVLDLNDNVILRTNI